MKQSLTLIALVLTLCVQGQSFFQDFEDGIEPMTLYDVDGLTIHQNVNFCTDAWTALNVGFGNGTNVAVSTSWYNPVGIADDWMVTPLIHLPDSNPIIRWDAKAQDANFRDGYYVYISTTGNTPEDFSEVVFQTAAEVTNWVTHVENLDAFAGQDVYIAFRNNSNDKFLLLIDNIFVGVQKQRDVSLVRVNANINSGTTLEGSRTLEITIQNFGIEAITSLQVTWNFNGDTITQQLLGINVASGAPYTFSHSTPVNYIVGEGYVLNVSIDSINGNADEQPDDNMYSSVPFKVFPPVPNVIQTSSDGEPINLHEILASGKAVIFDFFASWCVPCEISTPALNNLYVANGSGEQDLDVIGITVEPTDTDPIVNGLTWGATYPNLSFSQSAYELYIHFNSNHGLGANAIPFFVMVCPNLDDLAHSQIVTSYVGATDIANIFNNTWQPAITDCIESLPSAVKEIRALESFSILPNPAYDYLHIDFALSEPTEIAMEVLDVAGKSILRHPVRTFAAGENTERIDVSSFVSGTYFIRLTHRNAVNTLKFTVVH